MIIHTLISFYFRSSHILQTIQVEKIDFNPEDGELRISGVNIEENQWLFPFILSFHLL